MKKKTRGSVEEKKRKREKRTRERGKEAVK